MRKITTFLMLFAFALIYAQPTTNPTTPPARDAADVISIFGGGDSGNPYTNISGTDFFPNWGQPAPYVAPAFVDVNGNQVLFYEGLSYQGMQLGSNQNAAAMEFLHLDVWSPIDDVFQITPINSSGVTEVLVNVSVTGGQWTSIDIPKSDFTGMTWDDVFQFKSEKLGWGAAGPRGDFYIDNLYFWKTSVDPAIDATLSSLEVDNTLIAGFAPNITEYDFSVLAGTTTVPQITSATTNQTGANAVITQASAIPGTASVVVTAEDGTTTQTYTVNIVIEGPSTAAPTPPARASTDVISLFSEAYTDISVTTWSAPWDSADIVDVMVDGNETKKVTFGAFLGVDFSANAFDATQMTHFHIDYWIDEDLLNKDFNIKWSNHLGGAGETNAYDLSNNISGQTQGQWISLDIPLSDFTPVNGADRSAFAQFLITSNVNVAYIDNIYLHKNTTLNNTTFAQSKFSVYPNPSSGIWTIESEVEMTSVQLYNILGKLVAKQTIEGKQASISTEGLASGVYFAKVSNGNENTKTLRLVKN